MRYVLVVVGILAIVGLATAQHLTPNDFSFEEIKNKVSHMQFSLEAIKHNLQNMSFREVVVEKPNFNEIKEVLTPNDFSFEEIKNKVSHMQFSLEAIKHNLQP